MPSKQNSFRIPINNHGYALVDFGSFGYGYSKTDSQYEKLSYLLTMVSMTELCFKVDADANVHELFKQTDGFQILNSFVCKFCKGIALDSISLGIRQSIDKTSYYIDYGGYIDLPSYGCYDSLQDFINNLGLSVEEIILNDCVSIISNYN